MMSQVCFPQKRNEAPKSPRGKPETQRQYWT